MTVRREGDVIRLEGTCYVEDAETLVVLSQPPGLRHVDLSLCRQLHAAVVQVLLSLDLPVLGAPGDDFLREHVLPNLRSADAEGRPR